MISTLLVNKYFEKLFHFVTKMNAYLCRYLCNCMWNSDRMLLVPLLKTMGWAIWNLHHEPFCYKFIIFWSLLITSSCSFVCEGLLIFWSFNCCLSAEIISTWKRSVWIISFFVCILLMLSFLVPVAKGLAVIYCSFWLLAYNEAGFFFKKKFDSWIIYFLTEYVCTSCVH